MNPNPKKNIVPGITIGLVLGCIAIAVVSFNRYGISRSREIDTISVPEAKTDRPPAEKNVVLKAGTSSLVKTGSADPDDNRPVVASADQAFWRSESPDGSKIIEINNHTAEFELTDKVTGKKVSFSNWQKVGGIEYEVVKWTWKDNKTLVGPGWSDLNEDDERRDVGDVKIFIYQWDVSEYPEPVSAPSTRPAMCLRLEGFNKKGELLLAEVFLDGYKRYEKLIDGERSLGAFDILPGTR
jgi:hypothetical protein